MKILYITTVGATMNFFKYFFKELIDAGHTIELASNEVEWDYSDDIKSLGLKTYHIDCSRSLLSAGNINCVSQIKELVEKGEYDIVHCHTPIAGVCTRMACRNIRRVRIKSSKPLRVFYTAHGFHFYKGSPKENWLLYYPVEKLCARWTDTLITINHEDYDLAKRKFEGLGRSKDFKGCQVEYVPGVGIDVDKFANTVVDKKAKRAELGIPEDAFLLLSVGELNENKNHQIVIRALAELLKTEEGQLKNYYYIVAGEGPLKDHLHNLIDSLGLKDRVKLLGFRKDCAELYKTADVFVHSSLREGLPVSLMEAMATGIPVLSSRIRGCVDLVNFKYTFMALDKDDVANRISEAIEQDSVLKQIDVLNIDLYNVVNVNKEMRKLYFR